MDIDRLKKKRQLNVQEQNALSEHGIEKEARYWREKGLPLALEELIENKGIESKKCILQNYEQDFPGCSTDEGIVISEDGRFFEFEADFSKDRTEIVKLYIWEEVTEKVDTSERLKGAGNSTGYLVLKVLGKLNGV